MSATLEQAIQSMDSATAALIAARQDLEGKNAAIDASVAAQQAAFAAWRNQVFRQVAVTTELKQYRTILRVQPSGAACLFRLSLAGTTDSYVFAGLFDVSISHAAHIAVSYSSAHSAYGGLALRIKTLSYPGGATVEIMRTTGDAGIVDLSATITPYAGTLEVFTGSALAAPAATFEQTYS